VNHTGLVEVPLGTTLRKIIFDIGGGIPNNKKFKAAQTGGPSGGWLGVESLDLPMDYDSLREAGSIIGSGGLIVMDEESCMVDLAASTSISIRMNPAANAPPAGSGGKRMLELLQKITEGRGEEQDLEILEQLALLMKNGSLCALGRTAPNPLLSTLRLFRDEYLAHIKGAPLPRRGLPQPGTTVDQPGALQSLRPLRPGLPGGGDQR